MTSIPSPNELYQRLKNDPRTDIGQIVPGDVMCLFATHADGRHSAGGDFTVGQADDRIGEILDDLIAQEVGECGGQPPFSPIVSVEIIHACRVLGPWRYLSDLKRWIREGFRDSAAGGSYFTMYVGDVNAPQAYIDLHAERLRAEADDALVRAGWRLL